MSIPKVQPLVLELPQKKRTERRKHRIKSRDDLSVRKKVPILDFGNTHGIARNRSGSRTSRAAKTRFKVSSEGTENSVEGKKERGKQRKGRERDRKGREREN